MPVELSAAARFAPSNCQVSNPIFTYSLVQVRTAPSRLAPYLLAGIPGSRAAVLGSFGPCTASGSFSAPYRVDFTHNCQKATPHSCVRLVKAPIR